MNEYEIYDFSKVSSHALTYEFASLGPKGVIIKAVHFQETSDTHVFNLVFGNLNEDGSIDDMARDNNGDRNKVLATVVAIVLQFAFHHPDYFIFFSGSTNGRTRLYRMAISLYYTQLSRTLFICGLTEEGKIESFNSTHPYVGFLIKNK